MSLLEVFWASGVLLVLLVTQTHGAEFGICEKIVQRRAFNDSYSPPKRYTYSETIKECCYGFMTIGKKCIPVCKNPCVNAHCIGADKCQCNQGYYAVDNFRCLARCEPPCGDNMACMAPDKCFCKPGYKKVDGICEPICSFMEDTYECINANCVAHNQCECFEGYRNVSSFMCDPICSNCLNGDCISPEVCECHEGYEKDSLGMCQPICDPECRNADCVVPNTCECHENFEKYLKSHECLEKQEIKDHQSCVTSCEHGTCTDSAACICDSGFELFNGKCSKQCDKKCINGRCLEDQCICLDGYSPSENGTTECLPICAFEDGHPCIQGTCVAPQICECFPGYKFNDKNNCTCVPMCEPMCLNAVCTTDGCQCHDNFYKFSEHECIKNCSKGFTWLVDSCVDDRDLIENQPDEEEENTTETSLTVDQDDADYDQKTYGKDDEESDDNDDDEVDDEDSTEIIVTPHKTSTPHEDVDPSTTPLSTAPDTTTLSTLNPNESYDAPKNFLPVNDSPTASDTANDPTLNSSESYEVKKSFLPRVFPPRILIPVLSIVTMLVTLILITFYCLYKMNPKNIYHVEQQENSKNCVYFTTQCEPLSITEESSEL